MRAALLAPAVVAGVFLAMPTPGAAATIEVVSGPNAARAVQIAFFGPIGQSFIAIDTNLTSFAFQFQTFNAGAAAAPVQFSLLAGDGFAGAVIASRTLTLPATIPAGFFSFDVTGTTVTIGQRYTAVLSTTTSRYGIALGPEYNIFTGVPLGGDAYAGGRAYFGTQPYANCTNDASSNCDLNFRVTGTTAAGVVPEPATWAMMVGGFALAGGALRRRSRQATVRFRALV